MKYSDLRDFIAQLEKMGQLKRITQPISTNLAMTEISDRTLFRIRFYVDIRRKNWQFTIGYLPRHLVLCVEQTVNET